MSQGTYRKHSHKAPSFFHTDAYGLKEAFYAGFDLSLVLDLLSRDRLKAEAQGLDFKVYRFQLGEMVFCVKESLGNFKSNLKEARDFIKKIERLNNLGLEFIPPIEAHLLKSESHVKNSSNKIILVMPWLDYIPAENFEKVSGIDKNLFDLGVRRTLEENGFKLNDVIQAGSYEDRPYVYDLSSLV